MPWHLSTVEFAREIRRVLRPRRRLRAQRHRPAAVVARPRRGRDAARGVRRRRARGGPGAGGEPGGGNLVLLASEAALPAVRPPRAARDARPARRRALRRRAEPCATWTRPPISCCRGAERHDAAGMGAPFPLDRLIGIPADVVGALKVLPAIAEHTEAMRAHTAVLGGDRARDQGRLRRSPRRCPRWSATCSASPRRPRCSGRWTGGWRRSRRRCRRSSRCSSDWRKSPRR